MSKDDTGKDGAADSAGNAGRATTRDIAREAGVSVGTVSNVLRGRKDVRVSPGKKELVLLAAEKLGYELPRRPQRTAYTIAVCGEALWQRDGEPDMDVRSPPFSLEVAMHLLNAAEEQGCDLLFLSGTPIRERRASPAFYYEYNFDALIAWFAHLPGDLETLAKIANRKPVVVLFSSPLADAARARSKSKVTCVQADNRAIGRAAAGDLISRGHDRFLVVTGNREHGESRERSAGFVERVLQWRADVRDPRPISEMLRIVKPIEGLASYGVEAAENAGGHLKSFLDTLARGGKRTDSVAVFCWNDVLGIHLVRWARTESERFTIGAWDHSGRKQGATELAVIGVDNLVLGQALLEEYQLSSVSQPIGEMTRLAIQAARSVLAGGQAGQYIRPSQEPVVHTRKSTTRPPRVVGNTA